MDDLKLRIDEVEDRFHGRRLLRADAMAGRVHLLEEHAWRATQLFPMELSRNGWSLCMGGRDLFAGEHIMTVYD